MAYFTFEGFKQILQWLFEIGMYLNILAMLPQPLKMMKNKSSENVSPWMWTIFFLFQLAISLHGKLNAHSDPMFYGMGGSSLFSLFTLILCFVYKKPEPIKTEI